MTRLAVLSCVALLVPGLVGAQERSAPAAPAPRYGANPAAGRTFDRDGVRLYYEVYGTGEPLLLVHGNGGSIHDLAAQIAHFREGYMVIAVDSRGHGNSSESPGRLTYEAMADDLAALLEHLKTGPANVLGWSDGGIQALLLGMRHPAKVRKIAAMAANLNPTEEAIRPEDIALIKSMLSEIPEERRATPEGRREVKAFQLLLEEPHIDPKALGAIAAPTLVLAGDRDLIRDEHTLTIYHHVPNGQLAVFPNATHMVPFDDPTLFNTTVERFFRTPFVKGDRIGDTMKSFEKMRTHD